MLKVKHVPEQLLDVTITPVMFVLMFTYLFGGAIAGSTGEYLDYILPGILVMSVLFTTVYSGIALNTDLTRGRRRPLPLAADLEPGAAGRRAARRQRPLRASPGTVIIVLGVILGFRPDEGVPGVVAALALVVVFAFGLSWVFTTLGLLLRSPNAVMNAGFMAIFPLTFLSNVFVDPETLPAGLEAFVNVNPISILADASRGLMQGGVQESDVLISLGVAALLTAIFAPLTTRGSIAAAADSDLVGRELDDVAVGVGEVERVDVAVVLEARLDPGPGSSARARSNCSRPTLKATCMTRISDAAGPSPGGWEPKR